MLTFIILRLPLLIAVAAVQAWLLWYLQLWQLIYHKHINLIGLFIELFNRKIDCFVFFKKNLMPVSIGI